MPNNRNKDRKKKPILSDIYEMSDEEFRDYMARHRYRNGMITKEEAFLELI